MPPAISPTSLSCAYRKQCRMRMTSTCTSCSAHSLQACRFTPRLAQMAAAVSLLHHLFLHTCIYNFLQSAEWFNLLLFVNQSRSVSEGVQMSQFCLGYREGNPLTATNQGWTEPWLFFLFLSSRRLKMEDKAGVVSVSVSERCCSGPWWRTHCGLPPNPQRGESGGKGSTGGQVSWIKPATIIIQTCWVQRSAPLWGRKTRIVYDSRKSTSRWARKQSHTDG